MNKVIAALHVVLWCLCCLGLGGLAVNLSHPRAFTDPYTHRAGGWQADLGPWNCGLWTWDDNRPRQSYPPINCYRRR